MSIRNLEVLLHPKSVVLIGATNRKNSLGEIAWRNLQSAGFTGVIYAVNLKKRALGDTPVYSDVAGLPEVPDLALICTPADTVPKLIAQLGDKGVKAVIVLTTELSRSQKEAALKAAKPHLLRLLGPSGLGLITPGMGLNASIFHTFPSTGELALISQSGALAGAMLDWAKFRGLGFSHVISLGDSADVDVSDLLDLLGSDSRTRAIILYVESIGLARKFMSAARAAARNKPVIIFFAGSDQVVDAAIRRAGMLRVDTLQELFTALMAVTRRSDRRNEFLTVVSNGAGVGVVAADCAARLGVTLQVLDAETLAALDKFLPKHWSRINPIDITANAPIARYTSILNMLVTAGHHSTTLLIHAPTAMVSSKDIAQACLQEVSVTKNQVMSCWLGDDTVKEARDLFRQAGIADYATPEEAIKAFAMLQSYYCNQDVLMHAPAATEGLFKPDTKQARKIVLTALSEGRTDLTLIEVDGLLKAYGILTPRRTAQGMLDQSGKLELVLGSTIDSVFGPVIFIGHGQRTGEINGEYAVGLPPLNTILAEELIARARISKQNMSLEGRPPINMTTIASMLVALSTLLADLPEISEVEMNPLYADENGITATDARIHIAPNGPGGVKHFAILPYPDELVEKVSWKGETIILRPIHPRDELQHRQFLERLSMEDIRMRIFLVKKEIARSELARLTQIDYSREMAFIAERICQDGSTETLAAVRSTADSENVSAEFAILVRSDLKRQGLGALLIDKLKRHAKALGLQQIEGMILRENHAMREFALRSGFLSDSSHPTERDVVNVVLRL